MGKNFQKSKKNGTKQDSEYQKNRNNRNPKQEKAAGYYGKDGNARAGGNELKAGINGHNDVSWYSNASQLVRDTASIPFSNVLGLPIDTYRNQLDDSLVHSEPIPGVMAIEWIPAVGGKANVFSDAINVAARKLYSFVRHANSGSRNYEAPDLMTMVLAADSLYYLLMHGIRAYGIARRFMNENRYYSATILKAMGFQADDVYTNLAQFRAGLNLVSYKLAQISIPAVFSYFKRHTWLCSNVYTDRTNTKAQTYVYVPRAYWLWNATLSEKGSALEYKTLPISFTVDQYVQILENALQAMLSNEDIGIMSGDLLKAFGAGKMYLLPLIDENFEIAPIHDPEVLAQIHNTRTVNGVVNGASANITQSNQNLITEPFAQNITGYEHNNVIMLDSTSPDPSPEEVMVSTRNIVWTHPASDEPLTRAEIISCGSEIFTKFRIFETPSSNGEDYTTVMGVDATALQGSDFASFLAQQSLYTRFDWAPPIYTIVKFEGSSGELRAYGGLMWETDNTTTLSSDVLRRIHDVAIISELSFEG